MEIIHIMKYSALGWFEAICYLIQSMVSIPHVVRHCTLETLDSSTCNQPLDESPSRDLINRSHDRIDVQTKIAILILYPCFLNCCPASQAMDAMTVYPIRMWNGSENFCLVEVNLVRKQVRQVSWLFESNHMLLPRISRIIFGYCHLNLILCGDTLLGNNNTWTIIPIPYNINCLIVECLFLPWDNFNTKMDR